MSQGLEPLNSPWDSVWNRCHRSSPTPPKLNAKAFWDISWLQGPTVSCFPKDLQLLHFLESLTFRVHLKAKPSADCVFSQLCPSSLGTGNVGQADRQASQGL